jgi:hypothetical protein
VGSNGRPCSFPFSAHHLAELSHEIVEQTKRGQAAARAGKAALDELKAEGEELQTSDPEDPRLPSYRAQYFRLARLFVNTVKEHQRVKERARQVETDALVRRGQLLYGDKKSEAELRAAVAENPEGFVQRAMLTTAHADGGSGGVAGELESQLAVDEATARARDIQSIARCVGRTDY